MNEESKTKRGREIKRRRDPRTDQIRNRTEWRRAEQKETSKAQERKANERKFSVILQKLCLHSKGYIVEFLGSHSIRCNTVSQITNA